MAACSSCQLLKIHEASPATVNCIYTQVKQHSTQLMLQEGRMQGDTSGALLFFTVQHLAQTHFPSKSSSSIEAAVANEATERPETLELESSVHWNKSLHWFSLKTWHFYKCLERSSLVTIYNNKYQEWEFAKRVFNFAVYFYIHKNISTLKN